MAQAHTAPTSKDIMIYGHTVPISQPYTVGHPLTYDEALALNLARTNNIRENCLKYIKAATIAKLPDAIPNAIKRIKIYDENYVFFCGEINLNKLDPIEREVHRIILEGLREFFRTQKTTYKEYIKDKKNKIKIEKTISEHMHDKIIIALAKRRISDRARITLNALTNTSLG